MELFIPYVFLLAIFLKIIFVAWENRDKDARASYGNSIVEEMMRVINHASKCLATCKWILEIRAKGIRRPIAVGHRKIPLNLRGLYLLNTKSEYRYLMLIMRLGGSVDIKGVNMQ